MNTEFDGPKSQSNRNKHGVGFEAMDGFNWTFAICVDAQIVDGESRELWLGPISDDLFAAVTLDKANNTIRVISLRRATNTEIKIWKKEFQNG